jgi:hypothetical protein
LADFAGEVGFGLEATVTADVVHGNTVSEENAGDEQAAMAVRGIFFGAEERHAKFADAGFETRQTLLEEIGIGDAIVEDVAFGIVVFVAIRAATEFAAKIKILETGFDQSFL